VHAPKLILFKLNKDGSADRVGVVFNLRNNHRMIFIYIYIYIYSILLLFFFEFVKKFMNYYICIRFEFFQDGWEEDDPRQKDLQVYLRQLELAGKDALRQIIKKTRRQQGSSSFVSYKQPLTFSHGLVTWPPILASLMPSSGFTHVHHIRLTITINITWCLSHLNPSPRSMFNCPACLF
jgi:hypothetical protein